MCKKASKSWSKMVSKHQQFQHKNTEKEQHLQKFDKNFEQNMEIVMKKLWKITKKAFSH